ncbi:MAG: hypothetical protein J5612_02900 [Paludibacteraceae bacterium]|nr:hypothetical protein [Paludibacteraceae bacterium]
MDINATINWQPGLELTAQTFLNWEERLDARQRFALRAVLGSHRPGLLPDAKFSCKGMFVKNKLEIAHLRCLGVLPSGSIIDVDEPVTLPIPMLYGSEYYLAIGLGSGQIAFEKDDVPFTRPQYEYAILSMDEMLQADVLPLMRFRVNEGTFAVDEDFIPPYLLLSSDKRYKDYIDAFTEAISGLAQHPNLAEGDGKRLLLRYAFLLKGYQLQLSVHHLVQLTEEIAQALDYFIVTPNAEQPMPIPQPEARDWQKWFVWFAHYLKAAASILDGVVLEDNTIDYEALLAQAKKELYDQLNPELYEKLLLRIKDELREEIGQTLTETLTAYMNDTLKPELEQLITDNLHERMYDKLYNELYERLYNALYVPTPEEEEFMPQI